jgi:TonB family protein
MTTLRLTAALAAAALSLAPAAFAQEPAPTPPTAPAPPPAIVPPRPLSPLRAYYPEGGTGEHDVTVEITVTKEGGVKDARLVEGEPPYGDAAVKAADGWQFAPATRAGKPVVARIRVLIHFSPPAPEPPSGPDPGPAGEPAPSDKPASKPASPPEPAEIEVIALGERPAVGTVSLGRAEVRLLPGAFGDPFRAIEALPGVTPIVSGLPYFYVRGAPPGNVGYFIDNVRVPVLYHLGLGPSVIHPGLVERVDLYPGGYPAQYGRYTGGIVAGETRPAANEWRGEASLRLVDVGAMVEAPIGDCGAALVGGRYSYTAALLSLAAPGGQLDYWDYQGRFSWELSPRERITVFAFGSYDYLGQEDDEGVMQTLFSTQFHRLDLRYDAELSDKTRLRQAVTLGLDQSGFAGREGLFLRDFLIGARTQLVHRESEAILVRAGLDATFDAYDAVAGGDEQDETTEQLAALFPTRQDIVVGLYADTILDLGHGIEVTPGARIDLWGSRGATAFSADVRLALRVPVTKHVRLLNAVGLAHQAPGFVLPIPGVAIGSLKGGLQKSFQTSAGVEADLPFGFTGTATAFFNGFFGMSDALGTAGRDGGDDDIDINARSLGNSLGLEVFLKRRLTERLGGYVSYTLSRTTRAIGRESFVPRFDRTHVLNAAVSWDPGRGWRLGSRFVFYTGLPIEKNPFVPLAPELQGDSRLAPFFRIDARIEKRWSIGKRAWISLVLEMLNATLSKEQIALDCSNWTCKPQEIGPVSIPSLGVEGGF